MSEPGLRVLWAAGAVAPERPEEPDLGASAFGPFGIERCPSLTAAVGVLGERAFEAVVLCVSAFEAENLPVWSGLSQATPDAAVLVWVDAPSDATLALRLVRTGVQDVLFADAPPADLARSLRLAIERKRVEQAARKACATDLRTGLPNRQQLIDHMSQLLALRGREPAPMALLVLRVEGFDTTEAALGAESANVLRRKVAVRLRAAVRASDVVAALGADSFALLLASTEEPPDADHVARKVLAALHQPFALSGQPVGVAASAGISRFPADGSDAGVLMRRAVAAAAAALPTARDGFVNFRESVWHETGAANDANDAEDD